MRPLTPSETAYFHPHLFAREKKLLDAIALPHTDAKFDASELAESLLAVALVHAEDAGSIVLAAGKGSRLFGLRKVDVVEVSPGAKAEAFPPGTMEARIRALVAARPLEVQRVVHELLGEDSTYPDTLAIAAVQRGLVDAGILETTEVKRLGFLKVESLRVPDATRKLAAQAPAASVKARLDAWKAARAAEWEHVQKGIRKGIAGRKEASDGPD